MIDEHTFLAGAAIIMLCAAVQCWVAVSQYRINAGIGAPTKDERK